MVCLWLKHQVPNQEMIRIDCKSPTRKSSVLHLLLQQLPAPQLVPELATPK